MRDDVIVIEQLKAFFRAGENPKKFKQFCHDKGYNYKKYQLGTNNGFAAFILEPNFRIHLEEYAKENGIKIIKSDKPVDTKLNLRELMKYFA